MIIFSKKFEEHFHNIQLVFNKIKEATLKIAPINCQFLKRKVNFIGHIVSEKDTEKDSEKTEKVLPVRYQTFYSLLSKSATRVCVKQKQRLGKECVLYYYFVF